MHHPLQRKIFVRFLAILAMLGALTLLSSVVWFHRTLIREAQERVQSDLQAAHRLLIARSEQDVAVLEAVGQVYGELPPEEAALLYRTVARKNAFDLGGIFRIGGGPGERILSGVSFGAAPGWLAPLLRRPAGSGFVLVPVEELAEENPALADRIRTEFPMFPGKSRAFSRSEVLVAAAWVPAPPQPGRPAVLLYGGRVLNHNNAVVDGIRDLVFRQETVGGKPLGTVTLFQGDVRIATNVLGPGGERALGTPVSAAVFDRVYVHGQVWTDRALVVDRWYISAYRPLQSPEGKTVGMLYAGVLESRYLSLRNRILASYLGIFLLGALLAVVLSYFVSRSLVAPLQRLRNAAQAVHGGDLDVSMAPPPDASQETAELMAAFNEMIAAIRDRDTSLTGANERLRMINQRLEILNRNYTEMLGFVTHELSNMLGVILLDAHTLKEDLWERLGSEEREVLQSILNYLEKFRGMIRNFLDLSRIEKGKLEVNKARINLYWEVLQTVERELAGALQRGEMTLELDPSLEALELDADPNLMRVVFYNLIGNGVKYGYAKGRVRVFGGQEDAGWAVHVRNDGLGIPAEEIPRLSQQFYRIRMEGRQQREGSGLGLFISREIIERHGGRLEILSEYGSWADFIVHLPRKSGPEAAPAG